MIHQKSSLFQRKIPAFLVCLSLLCTILSGFGASASEMGDSYVLTIDTGTKTGVAAWTHVGQFLLLKPDTQYEFSYEYSAGSYHQYPLICGNRESGTLAVSAVEREKAVHSCAAFSFRTPALGADAEHITWNGGRCKIWVGIVNDTMAAIPKHYRNFCVTESEDPAGKNLMEDTALSSGGRSLDKSIWITSYGTACNGYVYKSTLENAGGEEIFALPEYAGVINGTDWCFLGQRVALRPNTEYCFSYECSESAGRYPAVYGIGENKIPSRRVTVSSAYRCEACVFTTPATGDSSVHWNTTGECLVWVGIINDRQNTRIEYYRNYRLYELNDTEQKNLFADGAFRRNGDMLDSKVWQDPYGTPSTGNVGKCRLPSDWEKLFQKPENVVRAEDIDWSFFGQRIALKPGTEYRFSCQHSGETGKMLKIFGKGQNELAGSRAEIVAGDRTTVLTFITPNAGSNTAEWNSAGECLVWVGIANDQTDPEPQYYRDFRLCESNKETEINLLCDGELSSFYDSAWCNPYGGECGEGIEKITLNSAGGESIFTFPGDANHDGKVSMLDLIRMKKFFAESMVKVYAGADSDQNGAVDLIDAVWIRKKLLGISTVIPQYGISLKTVQSSGLSSWAMFGQFVSLSPSTEYLFSYLYSDENNQYPVICQRGEVRLPTERITTDDGMRRETVRFTTPEADGNCSVWVGLQNNASVSDVKYYRDFALYRASDAAQINLLADSDLSGFARNAAKSVWTDPYGSSCEPSVTSVLLNEIGADVFLKKEYVGTIDTNGITGYAAWTRLGQFVTLNASEEYVFGYQYSDNNKQYPVVYSTAENKVATEKTIPDGPYQTVEVSFATPEKGDADFRWKDDEHCVVWVGIENNTETADVKHYRSFYLYRRDDPEQVNLLVDAAMQQFGTFNRSDIWKNPYGESCGAYVTKTPLSEIGGEYAFRKEGPDSSHPEVFPNAGANREAVAMRKTVRNSTDGLNATGKIYYVSMNGSDNNSGLSQSAPLATVSKAISRAVAGDTVLLKRGDIFRLTACVNLKNGVDVGAYGSGKKPEIYGSPVNYAKQSWQQDRENVWKISYTRSDVGIVVFDGGKLAGRMRLQKQALAKNGDFFFDNSEKMLYIYCNWGNPRDTFSDIEVGSRMILFSLPNGKNNIHIDNICFKYTGTFAIQGTNGCHDISITNCEIGWIGGSFFEDGSNRYGNGIEFLIGAQDILVENCWIYQVYDAGFTFQHSTSGDRTNLFRNICVRNNLIEYCSWAIEWYPTDNNAKIEQISFTDNILRFSGYGVAGDTRDPCLIHGPWARSTLTVSGFMVSGNIFDSPNGVFYNWIYANDSQSGHLISGNTYYQHQTTSGTVPVWCFGQGHLNDPGMVQYASDQEDLKRLISLWDSSATVYLIS